jgi:hypothetical protein
MMDSEEYAPDKWPTQKNLVRKTLLLVSTGLMVP